jgi:cell division protein FtsI (penicillin-binding protein 3)
VAGAVHDLAPGAIALVPDSERLYPLGSVAAPAIGFTGREELQTVGRSGFEHEYDQMLGGEPEQYLAIHDAVQRQLRLERLHGGRAGYDIVLTLNARLQASCEEELLRTVQGYSAASGSAVVLDPYTGHVLALASIPSFDPKRPASVPPERWRLRPVQDAWEPGSTMKPFVAVGALSLGCLRGTELFDCRRRGIDVAGIWIRDHADPGVYTLDQVIARSANAGIVTVAQAMPPASLHLVLRAFGFGRRPGIGFPAEASGILPGLDTWSRLSAAGLALGQELTASPLQIAVAYAALANGGWLPRPRLVMSASAKAAMVDGEPSWRSRVLSAAMAQRATDMLELVVDEGTGTLAHVPGYRIAGKTGTAQRAVPGGFDEEHHVAWFAGFLPLPQPRAVIVVAIEDPREDFWASTVAAPCFARIAEETMRILRIPVQAEADRSTRGGRT